MSWIWIVPAGMALVGGAVLAGLARRTAEEITGLRQDLARLGEVLRR